LEFYFEVIVFERANEGTVDHAKKSYDLGSSESSESWAVREPAHAWKEDNQPKDRFTQLLTGDKTVPAFDVARS
jgi:hypothetical protein